MNLKMILLTFSTIVITFDLGLCQNLRNYNEIPTELWTGIGELITGGNVSQSFLKNIQDLKKIPDKSIQNKVFCKSCRKVVEQIIRHRKSGASKESMSVVLKKICNTLSDWGPVACNGYVDIELDTVLFIIDNKKELTSARVCGIYYQANGCTDPNENKWRVDIPPISDGNSKNFNTSGETGPFTVLQLTDFHYDPLYKPGSNAICDAPLCCQEENGLANSSKNAAGFWGDYNVCDTPWHSITNFMDYIGRTIDKKDLLVYYTGDIISHKSWATTKDHNVDLIKSLYKLFKDTFQDVPLFPILGNHEPHPTDFYSPINVSTTTSKISTQWVLNLVADEWSRWLPVSTKETIKQGGFYTVLVKPGFRIVALNSNVCFHANLWLLFEDEDPYDQLKWLVETLSKAEEYGEKVHILSHIPPGTTECLQRWSHEFRKIVTRFSSIITAQFNGHTHLDELRLFYNDDKKVVNVAFNAGSFTTFVGLNPNYRVYCVDKTSLSVLDYDHYTFNLAKANDSPSQTPDWYKLYSLKNDYDLQNTSLEELQQLVDRMGQDKSLLKKYFRFQVRDSPLNMANGCDDQCLNRLLCTIKSVETIEAIQCENLQVNQ